jgi:hypothetical protein
MFTFAVPINHPRAEERRAQVALAEAIGARVYHSGNHTFVVVVDGKNCRRESLIAIAAIPAGWRPGPADPIGGWESSI